MGSPGLIKFLRAYLRYGMVSEMKGKVAGIDISIWVVKAIYKGGGLQWIFRNILSLRSWGIECCVVFDGADIDAKKGTKLYREKLRDRLATRVKKLVDDKEYDGAVKLCKRVKKGSNSLLKRQIKKWCHVYNVRYVQSPYEADAELAFLMKKKEIDFVISEDSDLVTFGCEKILYKYKHGLGEWFDKGVLEKAFRKPVDMECFRAMCINVGCDYLRGGLRGFGMKAAQVLYSKLAGNYTFQSMIQCVNQTENEEFKRGFEVANNTFLHQVVFDPVQKQNVPLTDYPEGKSSLDFLYAGNLDEKNVCFFNPLKPLDIDVVAQGKGDNLPFCCTSEFLNYLNTNNKCLCVHPFGTFKDLQQHKLENHSHECIECQKKFSCQAYLFDHLKLHNPNAEMIECPVCSKRYKNNETFKKHLRCHGERKYPCLLCDWKFKLPQALKRHMRTHTGEKPFVCSFCQKGFATKQQMEVHMISHTGKMPFTCSVCQKGFPKKQNMEIHMKSHTGEKPFVCSVCQKGFPTKQNMEVHMKSHTGEKPFVCSVCQKGFARKDVLNKHMLRHIGDKQHVCSVCQKGFARKDVLNKHMLRHIGDKQHVCSVCQKGFARKDVLNKHMRRHNKE